MWKNLRRTPDRDRTISKYVLSQWRRFLDDGHPPCKLMMRDCQFRVAENDRGDDPSAGEAHSGGSAADHPAAPWAESVRRLGEQDGADWSLAHADHTHREVFCTLCFCMWHDNSTTYCLYYHSSTKQSGVILSKRLHLFLLSVQFLLLTLNYFFFCFEATLDCSQWQNSVYWY